MYMRSVRKGRKFLCSCFRYGWMLLLPAMSVTPALGCGAATDCNVQDNRHYRIHMLDGATGALVFAHGFGGSAKGTIDNSGLLRIAESHGLSLVALKSAAKDWSIANAPSKVTQTGIDEVGYVDAVMADISVTHGLKASESVFVGFSAGAMMTWTVACELGDMFAGFVPIAGVFWAPEPESCPAPPVSVVHLHGRSDEIVPLEGRKVMDTHQGNVAKVVEMYADHGEFRFDGHVQGDGLACDEYRNSTDLRLELCLFDGGHAIPTAHLRDAIARLMD